MTSQQPPETPPQQVPPPGPIPPQPPYVPPRPAPPPRRSSAWLWGCGFGLGGCLLLALIALTVGVFAVLGTMGGAEGLSFGEGQIALIRIEGTILAGTSDFSLWAGRITGAEDVVREIRQAVKDPEVKAILLRVNSPGGSAAGSQEIYNAIRSARRHQRKVVVSMADVAASGGYYVSAGADKIYADPATTTGSIGVIFMHEDMSGLFDKIGVKAETIKSGELKDMLAPTGPMTEEARAVVRSAIMQIYDQFVQAVAEGRGMEVEAVRKLADGRIYTGEQAVKNGLVDELGGMQEALRGTAVLAGIKGEPKFKRYAPPSLLRRLLGGSGVRYRGQVGQVAAPTGLLYDNFAARLVWGTPEHEWRQARGG